MSTRHAKGDRSRRKSTPSVVGSKLGDAKNRLGGRGLPRGGIRNKDGLTVADGAMPDTTLMGKVDGKQRARGVLRIIAIVSGSLVVLLLLFSIVMAILSNTSMFSVQQIDTYDSEHLTAETVARLAAIDGNTTLLNVDTNAIEARVKKNPWVGSVDVVRVFPSTLRLEVHERIPAFYVEMGSGGVGWLMGEDGVWIEPLQVESKSGQSANDVALKKAESLGVLLICNVPTSVSPEAGTPANDRCIDSVMAFRSQLSAAFREQIVSYSASSEDDIAVVLNNGIEISLGSPSNIDSKEKVAQSILDEYTGQVTYINVRVPSRPTYRRVNSKYVDLGTGATGVEIESMKADEKNSTDTKDSTGTKDSSSSTTTTTGTGNGTTGNANSSTGNGANTTGAANETGSADGSYYDSYGSDSGASAGAESGYGTTYSDTYGTDSTYYDYYGNNSY